MQHQRGFGFEITCASRYLIVPILSIYFLKGKIGFQISSTMVLVFSIYLYYWVMWKNNKQ